MPPPPPSTRRAPNPVAAVGLATLALAALIGLPSAAARAETPSPTAEALEAAAGEVSAVETAFAKTMADRDLAAFGTFVADDAVFRGRTLRIGRAAVLEGWKPLFDGATAPFSWKPDAVTVAADGRHAISTGPVRDAQGQPSGRYLSLWRREADGRWRIAVDEGVDPDCAAPAK